LENMIRKSVSGLLLSLLLATSAVAEENNKVEQFGDWGKQCQQNVDGKEVCFIFQKATNKDDGKVVLMVRIAYKPGDSTPSIVATVPLGVLLTTGAALMLDGAEPLQMPFLSCVADGCTTLGTPLPEDMVAAMRNGDKASVRVATFSKQVIALPVSLKGFSKGLDAIKPD
jgi:invasion protein IalB